jgi:nicotinate-nucleotide adenylyltransferase
VWIRPPAPISDGLRVGLLGGSFNPAHEGHLHVSAAALKALELDYVWWLVSPHNPLKPEKGMADFEARIGAARALVRNRRIIVSGIEAALGTRYTADTLTQLTRRFSRVRFVWLMGSDNLVQIPRWRNWRAIFRLVPIAVVARPGSALGARCGKAADVFRSRYAAPDKTFATRRTPVWTIIEARRNYLSATRLRSLRAKSL